MLVSLRAIMAMLAAVAIGCTATAAASPGNDDPSEKGDDDDDDATSSKSDPKKALEDAGLKLPTPPAGGSLVVSPRALYSGFDGTHSYAAPFGVAGDAAPTVTLSDPNAGTIEPVEPTPRAEGDKLHYFLVTAKKAGAFTINATSGTRSGKIAYEVTAYDAARWNVGNDRYAKAGVTGDPACASCHAGPSGVDHSPAALAGANDIDVGAVLVSGITTHGFPINGEKQHRWDLTAEQRAGVVTYLRSLEPRGFAKP